MFQSCPHIRPWLDQIEEPPALASNMTRLEGPEIKFVARGVLEALNIFTTQAMCTQPDNILINYGCGTNRFSEVELGDCADAYSILRSPEANLQLRWGTTTDIWSFGATPISLLWGQDWHIFVLAKQASLFGPFPLSYVDIANEERQGILAIINNYMNKNGLWKPFATAEDPELTLEDRTFICKIMRMDPRDKPTAKELLEDPWLN
ncbi:hypothetical protein BDU57DRAFT_590239 [Ampelomyces quisqualis]|uniref:Protein kinase domain-containing protein n=1 Tax=Ampelomyces quisqualis TaxID=50730 RepID=A0A6A5QAC2_AMPQU|nr:hypothetical protein BDU57DRAFT_590239 [Ampelomyces quisqualis]